MDWSGHFPAFVDPDPENVNLSGARKLVKDVEVVDIGCGFGGLLVELASLMPDTLMIGTSCRREKGRMWTFTVAWMCLMTELHIGMEIRIHVLEFVRARIHALRLQKPVPQSPPPQGDINTDSPNRAISHTTSPEQKLQQSTSTRPGPYQQTPPAPTPTTISAGPYQNISGIRANTMKFMPNFFSRAQLHSIYICFPDPHFKARKHKARIVSQTLNAEYAFVLRPGGKVYTITDVEELHRWIVGHFEKRDVDGESEAGIKSLWERLGEEELASDPCVKVMMEETEEGKKVTRNNGRKFVAVWRRKPDPAWPSPPQSP